jgi:hypothetical protein
MQDRSLSEQTSFTTTTRNRFKACFWDGRKDKKTEEKNAVLHLDWLIMRSTGLVCVEKRNTSAISDGPCRLLSLRKKKGAPYLHKLFATADAPHSPLFIPTLHWRRWLMRADYHHKHNGGNYWYVILTVFGSALSVACLQGGALWDQCRAYMEHAQSKPEELPFSFALWHQGDRDRRRSLVSFVNTHQSCWSHY